ncbi:MAG: hypothetical protein M3Z64_07095, partial [Verrucomicrobiota bacterium]|nr:hypothetical protein [Verrucomicrobiota bacterium]
MQTIAPLTVLPDITEAVTIDGYSQPGAAPSTNGVDKGLNAVLKIELSGANLPQNGSKIFALRFTAGGNTVKGLVINRFSFVALAFSGGIGNQVLGNYIGTDPTGEFAPTIPNT